MDKRKSIDFQNSYRAFENLARNILNVDFVLLDNKLVPKTDINRILMPRAVAVSYDELFFGGALLELEAGRLTEFTERFCSCFAVLRLWNGEGWVLLGPYMPERAARHSTESILVENELPTSLYQEYMRYYQDLPVLGWDKISAVFGCVSQTMFGRTIDMARPAEVDLTGRGAVCPVFEEDKFKAYAEMIETRYEGERYLMQCVAKGDYASIEPILNAPVNLQRIPNRLRNDKNLLIVLNTLLRKSLESAQVHPLYIDRISTHYAMCIEQMTPQDSVVAFRGDMVRAYCEEAKRHSLACYSPPVRKAMEYIQFNLSSAVCLDEIANKLKINSSYLSSLFNKEAGQSIPDYISDKRIAESCRLMKNPGLSIGQIAAAVGYQDVNYFSRIFKRKMTMTPSGYRRLLNIAD